MEYQYYEFQAIDCPLTQAEQDFVRSLSSRVKPSATRATFTYSHGDFPGNPLSVLEKCFDAMLYMANWGSYQLAFRFPKTAVDIGELQVYTVASGESEIEVYSTENFVILNIAIHDENAGDWIEEDNLWMGSLLPLRQAILKGDYRVLYLAWLKVMDISNEIYEEVQEPPVPPKLHKLTSPLKALIDWLEIDPDLIAVATQQSPTEEGNAHQIENWIKALSEAEKTQLLLEIAMGDSSISAQLQARLRQKFKTPTESVSNSIERRSFAILKSLATEHSAERQAQEKAVAIEKRRQYLESLKSKQTQLWATIQDLIARKQAQPYDEAVRYLVDLRDLAKLEGTSASFQSRIKQIKMDYSNRPGLLKRMQDAQL
jgi:hypothetical protein